MSNETISLRTTFSNGTGGEAKLYHFDGGQLDAEGHPAPDLAAISATSNQAQYVRAFTHADDSTVALGDVDIRSVGKTPLNITSALVTVSDGRTVNGLPVQYQITVQIVQNEDLSAIFPVSSDPVRSL